MEQKTYMKQYYQQNKEQIAQKGQQYYQENKEQRKQDYQENKEQRKQYIQENKTKIANYMKQYYQQNKKKITNYTKQYYKCRSCKLFQTKSKSKYLCSYCNPVSSNREKTKENKLKTFLELYYTVTHNKKVNQDTTCQTYYPDFIIDAKTFFIVVECDEYAHKTYPKDC